MRSGLAATAMALCLGVVGVKAPPFPGLWSYSTMFSGPFGQNQAPFRGKIVEDGSAVFHWVASNLSNGASQSKPFLGPAMTVAGAPTVSTFGTCGYPVSASGFSGSNVVEYSPTSPSIFAMSAPFMAAIVFVPNTASADQLLFTASAIANGTIGLGWAFAINDDGPTGHAMLETFMGATNSTMWPSAASYANNSINVLIGGVDGSGNIWGKLNAGSISEGGVALFTPSDGSQPTYIGRWNGVSDFHFTGNVLEIYVTKTAPSTASITQLHAPFVSCGI